MNLRHFAALLALLFPAAAFAQNAAVETALAHFDTHYLVYGLSEADVSDLHVSDAYVSRRSGTTHVYLRQRFEGIQVDGADYTVNVDRDGDIFHKAGQFETSLLSRVGSSSPAITALQAAEIFAHDAGLSPVGLTVLQSEGGPDQAVTISQGGVALYPIDARLVYRPAEHDSELTLAWQIDLYEASTEHYWHGHVDALTGEVLYRHDQVVHDQWFTGDARFSDETNQPEDATTAFQPAEAPMAPFALVGAYTVFELPVESPDHSIPALPADGRTVHANPDDPTASPFGWHDTNGVAGPEFTDSRGNNVDAHKGATRSAGGGSLIFNDPANFANSPLTFVPAAITNAFYLSNILHDVTYQYGFDEPAGNFQENNYGNGGAGSDGVDANVQASGNCNANFGTPSDGSNPTMNMFLCTGPNPDADTDFDTGVLFHEVGHGISNRLTGGPGNSSCLNNLEQAGEGWSDFYGMVMTMKATDTATTPRPMANYSLTNLPPGVGNGIRPRPYTTDFAVNNYTYGRTTTMGSGQQHSRGFVFNTILWEVLWELIDAHGFDTDVYNAGGTAGNVVMIQLVTEGLKLQPCSPGFVDARDGILQADINLYGGAHLLPLWTGFARRGLGEHADQGSSNSVVDNVEDFTIPDPVPVELVGFSATVDGSDVVLNWNTASETNNAGFEIQMLTEGADSDVLGFVEGHGTTTEARAYSFRAADVAVGTHTFRLKQIDFDGAFEYSGETEVTVGVVGTHVLSEIYPNPFNPQAQFTLAVASAQNVNIAVYDVVGRQITMLHEGQLDANETYHFSVNGANLPSGAYFIRVTGETFADTQRMTLLR